VVWRGTDVVLMLYWWYTVVVSYRTISSVFSFLPLMEAASISQTLVIYKFLGCHGICCSKYSIIGSYTMKDDKFASVSFSIHHSNITDTHSPNYIVFNSEGRNVNIPCHQNCGLIKLIMFTSLTLETSAELCKFLGAYPHNHPC
jgi:hypothetical protein